jgi:hypothetical protein
LYVSCSRFHKIPNHAEWLAVHTCLNFGEWRSENITSLHSGCTVSSAWPNKPWQKDFPCIVKMMPTNGLFHPCSLISWIELWYEPGSVELCIRHWLDVFVFLLVLTAASTVLDGAKYKTRQLSMSERNGSSGVANYRSTALCKPGAAHCILRKWGTVRLSSFPQVLSFFWNRSFRLVSNPSYVRWSCGIIQSLSASLSELKFRLLNTVRTLNPSGPSIIS